MALFRKTLRLLQNKILVLVDVDNFLLNTIRPAEPATLRFPGDKLDGLMIRLGEIGQIMPVFAFAPASTLNRYGDQLRRLGFFALSCPVVVTDKEGSKTEKKDTVDPTLIDFGRRMIPILKQTGLTHFCLVSGDADFLPLIREAISFGLEVIVVAGDEDSLSKETQRTFGNRKRVRLITDIDSL